jgi:hypothetical protein
MAYGKRAFYHRRRPSQQQVLAPLCLLAWGDTQNFLPARQAPYFASGPSASFSAAKARPGRRAARARPALAAWRAGAGELARPARGAGRASGSAPRLLTTPLCRMVTSDLVVQ